MRQEVHNVVRIAARQHGVVTTAQLLNAGFTHSAVLRWREKGLLHPCHRGVYRLGHRARSADATYMAAVLACGSGAALSGLPAAFRFGLLRGGPPPPEVTSSVQRRFPGVISRRRTVPTRRWDGILTTTLRQTLLDLGGLLDLESLGLAFHRADVRFRIGAVEIPPRTPGIANLRAVVEGDHALLLSRLEKRTRALLRDHRLPLPITNRRQGDHFVDCRWPGLPLTVELDSFRFHRSRHAWEADRDRERAARARGDEFRRYTWRDVVEQPQPTLVDLVRLLGPSARSRSG